MRFPFDKGSKWLLQHQGASILRLGGAQGIASWKALQAEVVQPSRLPDGLLEVTFEGRTERDLFIVEIATYPDPRVAGQMIDDALLVYLDRRVLPEVLTLVLHPKGNLRVLPVQDVQSRLGWTALRLNWKVVELWTLPAEELLAANDVGLIPWVPLTHFAGPPEPVLDECRRRVEQQAPPDQRANLLAVTQVMARLRYNVPQLLALLGGSQVMIESPLIQELMAGRMHKDILRVLTERFGTVAAEVAALLRTVQDEDKLDELVGWAVRCPDPDAFRARLTSQG